MRLGETVEEAEEWPEEAIAAEADGTMDLAKVEFDPALEELSKRLALPGGRCAFFPAVVSR
jgi:hypothetical protein